MNKNGLKIKPYCYIHFIWGVLFMDKPTKSNGRSALEKAFQKESTLKQDNYPSNSIDEHRAVETGNILLAEKEFGQQNENL
jgi:hypothetical protein